MTGQTHEEIKRQATKDALLHTIATSKCQWPNCPEQHDTVAKLPVMLKLPDGRLQNLPHRNANGDFCVYHAQIANRLCAFAIKSEGDSDGQLLGPLEMIYTIECVLRSTTAWSLAHPGCETPLAIPGGAPAAPDAPEPVSPDSPAPELQAPDAPDAPMPGAAPAVHEISKGDNA